MARILALDYGKKRTGIAVTDPLQIIANGLITVPSKTLVWFLKDYFKKEEVSTIVLGYPTDLAGRPTDATASIEKLFRQLNHLFNDKEVVLMDERLTSKISSRIISQSGMSREKRQDKGLIDKISATIILQDYLQLRENQSQS